MKILGLIPARGGSKSIPNKSILNLHGFPMLAYSVAAGKMSRLIDRVMLSTDSPEIAEVGKKYGAEVPFFRPSEYAKDDSPDIEYIRHTLLWMLENEKEIPDLVVLLRPTTPLRDPNVIDEAIKKFSSHATATSLRSAHPASESPFKWFLQGKEGFFSSIQEGCSNDSANLPRQSFPEVFIPNGFVDIIKPANVLKNHILYGDFMLGFVTKPCYEVDSPEDVSFLKYFLENNDTPLFRYLKKPHR